MPLFLLGLVLSLPLCFMRTFVIFYAILHTLVRPFVLYSPTRHLCSLPLLKPQLQLRPSQSFLFDPRHPHLLSLPLCASTAPRNYRLPAVILEHLERPVDQLVESSILL
ncbi:hypothetical protein BJ322DRAFT_1037176 [Thelephora terrestris]|uniref:Uncharacterized protein n=1 Tax=Thelephora terrestris TaxID=56493 RepID=A0A9P6LAW8_9AGAM|nr:hypothetical protein BJ322DRAFT_1037176 [Thelephora terrestris]